MSFNPNKGKRMMKIQIQDSQNNSNQSGCYVFTNLLKLFDIFKGIVEKFTNNVQNPLGSNENAIQQYNVIYEIIQTEITFLHYIKHIIEFTDDIIKDNDKTYFFYGLNELNNYAKKITDLENLKINIEEITKFSINDNSTYKDYLHFINIVTKHFIISYFDYDYFIIINQLVTLYTIYTAERGYETFDYKCSSHIQSTIVCSTENLYMNKKFSTCGKNIFKTQNSLNKIINFMSLYSNVMTRTQKIELFLIQLLGDVEIITNNKYDTLFVDIISLFVEVKIINNKINASSSGDDILKMYIKYDKDHIINVFENVKISLKSKKTYDAVFEDIKGLIDTKLKMDTYRMEKDYLKIYLDYLTKIIKDSFNNEDIFSISDTIQSDKIKRKYKWQIFISKVFGILKDKTKWDNLVINFDNKTYVYDDTTHTRDLDICIKNVEQQVDRYIFVSTSGMKKTNLYVDKKIIIDSLIGFVVFHMIHSPQQRIKYKSHLNNNLFKYAFFSGASYILRARERSIDVSFRDIVNNISLFEQKSYETKDIELSNNKLLPDQNGKSELLSIGEAKENEEKKRKDKAKEIANKDIQTQLKSSMRLISLDDAKTKQAKKNKNDYVTYIINELYKCNRNLSNLKQQTLKQQTLQQETNHSSAGGGLTRKTRKTRTTKNIKTKHRSNPKKITKIKRIKNTKKKYHSK
jgi:hypothetical protein